MPYKNQCCVCRKHTGYKPCHPYQKAGNYSDCVDLYLCDGCLSSPFMKKYEENFEEANKLQDEIYNEFHSRGLDIFTEWQNDRMNFLFNKYEERA